MKRSSAVDRRVRPHLVVDDPDAPGCCATCHLPTTRPNELHVDQLPAVDPDVLAAERARLGEKD